MLDGYFSIHAFSNREKIIVALLKATAHIKYWWETYSEKKHKTEPTLFSAAPIGDSFGDAMKEKYYPIGNYEYKYIKWTML